MQDGVFSLGLIKMCGVAGPTCGGIVRNSQTGKGWIAGVCSIYVNRPIILDQGERGYLALAPYRVCYAAASPFAGGAK